jgi:hypothetical protein
MEQWSLQDSELKPANKGTNFLLSAEQWSCQDSEIKADNKGHSLSVEHKTKDLSGQEKKVNSVKGTHFLWSAEPGTLQDNQRK